MKNEFWVNKIENNRRRDNRTAAYLEYHGWVVIRIWEHNINKDINKEVMKILAALKHQIQARRR